MTDMFEYGYCGGWGHESDLPEYLRSKERIKCISSLQDIQMDDYKVDFIMVPTADIMRSYVYRKMIKSNGDIFTFFFQNQFKEKRFLVSCFKHKMRVVFAPKDEVRKACYFENHEMLEETTVFDIFAYDFLLPYTEVPFSKKNTIDGAIYRETGNVFKVDKKQFCSDIDGFFQMYPNLVSIKKELMNYISSFSFFAHTTDNIDYLKSRVYI